MASPAPEKRLLDTAVVVLKEKYEGWSGPVIAAYAPGRVNLIGDHTDYNEGFVFPMCLELGTVVVGAKAAAGTEVRIYSTLCQRELCCDVSSICNLDAADKGQWASYVKGTIAKFAEGYKEKQKGKQGKEFECPAFSAVIDNSISPGSGLSSSASLEVAMMTFLEELTNCRLKPERKAQLCQAAEREYAGVPCGIMDQMISVMGKAGSALMLDCRSLKSVLVPIHAGAVKVLITNSMVQHNLSGSEYPNRVASCQAALSAVNKHAGMSLAALRDVELPQVLAACDTGGMNEETKRRARHVITENARCTAAVTAFKAGDFATVGKLMHESHVSLRDDYNVSCAECDALVEISMAQPGVWGSRMTGAGFGGCVVSLVSPEKLEAVKAALSAKYKDMFAGKECHHITSDACAGSRRVDMALFFPEQHGLECIVQAGILKDFGNELFKAGDHRRALEKYNRIPLAIKGLMKKSSSGGAEGGMGMVGGMMNNKDEQALTDEEREEVKKLWQACHINRAMCYIKLEKWEKGVEACDEAISAGSQDVKAYFRRGKCYGQLGEVDKARADFNIVQEKDPSNASLPQELLELAKRQKVQDKKAKTTFSKMFS